MNAPFNHLIPNPKVNLSLITFIITRFTDKHSAFAFYPIIKPPFVIGSDVCLGVYRTCTYTNNNKPKRTRYL